MANNKQTLGKDYFTKKISSDSKVDHAVTKTIIDSFFAEISKTLSDGKRLEFRNFGVFKTVTRKAKVGRNPKNPGEAIPIPERLVVKFTPGRDMRDQAGSPSEELAGAAAK